MKNLIAIFTLLFFILFSGEIECKISESVFHSGTVKFFNENKKHGYIVDQVTHEELFVYDSGLIDEIQANDKVIYLIADTRKGLEAFEVRLKH